MTAPSTNPQASFEGRRLGEFVLGERIGEGSFGAIFLAEQVGLARQVVVKILRSHFLTDETTRLRFLREARLASTLDHPYAAHVYAFGVEPDGVSWIAMELVRGTSLSEVMRERTMGLRELVPFFERLCEVVQTAHEHGIVHRDIKPQNVMVIARAGTLLPKLLDLGIAKDAAMETVARDASSAAPEVAPRSWRTLGLAEAGAPSSSGLTTGDRTVESSLTIAGDMMGSPPYMAPEQWTSADQVDARCDIYALGAVAYEVIAGRRPFAGTLRELAEQHFLAALPPLPEGLPRELHAVLARAMAKEPKDRYSSALELARALREASRLGVDGLQLPRLARDAAELALRDYPQPLAEAVEELEAARDAHRALDAAARLVRVTLRMLTVIGLAAWSSVRAELPLEPAASELLSALRKRRLEDEEWLDLVRALAASAASNVAVHPVPDLVLALQSGSPAIVALAALLERRASRATLPTELAAIAELSIVLARTSELLRALACLSEHPLAVVTARDRAELWTGVRRNYRVSRPLAGDTPLEPETPVLFGRGDRALVLAPLAVAARPSPSPNAEPELFLLEGRSRRGLVLVAQPRGFEQTSETALRWLDRMSTVSDNPPSSVPTLQAPYRGLAPLTAADADVFFGREGEVEAFLNRLRAEPLLVVVGPSGAGKSSFVRAGVVPALGESSHAVVFRPGATPLATLRMKLAHLGVRIDDLTREADAGEVAARVHAAAAARDETVVIVVDQLEEVFTLAHDHGERAAFCAWLTRIAGNAHDPVRVVLTLRDDFLTRLQRERGFEHRLAHALELLTTPGEAALRRILVEPARRAGFAFESDALVDAMVRAVEGRPGALALLSFAASKLWEQRDPERRVLTSASYDAMGGVAGALAQHGEAVLEQMSPKQRALVRAAFRRLVTAEGTRAATRHDELVTVLGGDESARVVLERLVAARLLVVAEGDDGAEHVEVIHEALLSAWPRIALWQREDAAGNRFRAEIRAAAQQWEARKRTRGLLWRDELVEDYRRWLVHHGGGLTASEEAFGKASLAERARGRRLRAAVMILLATAALVTSYVAWQQSLARKAAQRATQQATRATEEATQANRHAEQSAFRARDAARLSAVRLHTEDPTLQLVLLRDLEAKEPLPEWAPEARTALHAGVASVVHALGTEGVWSVVFSPDGRHIASSSQDGTVGVWNADGTGAPLVLRGHTGSVGGVAFSPDGARLASSSFDKTVRVENADGSGEAVVLRGHTGEVASVAFSPDGRRVVSGSDDQTVRVWNADGSGVPVVLRGHTDIVYRVAFSPDGRRVASASKDKTVRVWNADGSGAPVVFRGHADIVYGVSFSPDGRRIASASEDTTVRVWNADGSGAPVVLRGHTNQVNNVAFSPDGAHVASASEDKTVRVWNADGSGAPVVLRGHTSPVFGVSFSPDGSRVVSSDGTGSVRVWRADVPEDPLVLRGHAEAVEGVAISADGRRIASASDDKTVRVWNADGSGDPIVLRGHANPVYGVAFSPDGRRIASSSQDKTVRIWNADGSGKPIVLRGHSSGIGRVAFSPDGLRVASVSFDGSVRVWSADGAGEPLVFRGDDSGLLVSFSPDGRRIVSASLDGTLRVWSADGVGDPVVLRGHDGRVFGGSFSPDGHRIASASQDKTVRVWSADGVGEPLVLRGHTAIVTGASFSPDGRQIASSSYDKTIRIWSADGKGDPVVLHGHTDVANAVAFSPDGRRLVSASDDKTVRIWSDMAPLLPTDPRLWQATSQCLSLDLLEQLLGVDDDVARTLRARCVDHVAITKAAER